MFIVCIPAKANSLPVQTFMANKSLSDSDSGTYTQAEHLRGLDRTDLDKTILEVMKYYTITYYNLAKPCFAKGFPWPCAIHVHQSHQLVCKNSLKGKTTIK